MTAHVRHLNDLTASARVAEFIRSATVDDETRRRCISVIVDTLAVTLAGSAEPGVKALEATLEPASGHCVPSLWSPHAYRRDDAALLIGMASHILDYDDVSMLAVCHPTAPVLTAALCAVPWADLSGTDLVDAVAIGTEVMIRTGQAMGFRHYDIGFHATATLGTMGAAAAAARLMGLDQAQTINALAIAASLASGLRKNFGSMVKSLHVGLAASNGVKAAQWAKAGITGAADPLESEGFLRAFSGGSVDHWPDDLALSRPFVLAEPGFEQKRYPCCYMLHRMIEGTLTLVRDTGVSLDDVASAEVSMPKGGTKPLIHPFPKTGLNALFSGPYAVAASLRDGRINLKSFTDKAVARPDVQARLADISLVERDGEPAQGSDLGNAPVTVQLVLRDGTVRSQTILVSPGSFDDPLTASQLLAKWSDCLERANPAINAGQAAALFEQAMDLAALPSIDGWLHGLAGTLRSVPVN
ncbi:MmgE/PrpD family protein [Phreatobacter aquaticus]|uniref:MmgE/PrpD family protein n=1 Tax=Phreatobacter aquaticus TaxID=2570229 RepID=A0A4D7QHL5_9HYPH|nr:MmgE/PrpD family protein [Phreatobacter aquaticus]QCK84916.1 MmgE/PrpD family protein [Phreatobacter aquaticus]